jgi:hypothetical protein
MIKGSMWPTRARASRWLRMVAWLIRERVGRWPARISSTSHILKDSKNAWGL